MSQHERNLYSVVIGWRILRCQVFLLIDGAVAASYILADFCLLDLPISDRWLLKSPALTTDSSISLCSSIRFCLTYFNSLLLVQIIYFKDCYVFLENSSLYHYVMSLFTRGNFLHSLSLICHGSTLFKKMYHGLRSKTYSCHCHLSSDMLSPLIMNRDQDLHWQMCVCTHTRTHAHTHTPGITQRLSFSL